MPRIRAQQQTLEDRIGLIGDAPEPIMLAPAALSRFRRSTDDLRATLDDHARSRTGSRASGSRAVSELRSLIERVTIHPDSPRAGFDVEVRGRLDDLIREKPVCSDDHSGGRLVAREGFEPPTQGL